MTVISVPDLTMPQTDTNFPPDFLDRDILSIEDRELSFADFAKKYQAEIHTVKTHLRLFLEFSHQYANDISHTQLLATPVAERAFTIRWWSFWNWVDHEKLLENLWPAIPMQTATVLGIHGENLQAEHFRELPRWTKHPVAGVYVNSVKKSINVLPNTDPGDTWGVYIGMSNVPQLLQRFSFSSCAQKPLNNFSTTYDQA